MKKIPLDEIASKYQLSEYKELYAKVIGLIDSHQIKPVKASGINGKSPALYREYWLVEEEQDISQYAEELNYEIVPAIATDYYRSHIEQYIQDRKWVLLLNDYLKNSREKFMTQMSENERSFDIWHREKFLKQEQGRKILKRCGMEAKELHFYRTTEPIAYYSAAKQTPQNLLVIENKDTFYSMRRFLIEGNDTICGERIDTLIYGAGKGIIAAFADFDISGEPYMSAPGNRIYYFGDLDYEGIGIYENFAAAYGSSYTVKLFKNAYVRMLAKAERMEMDSLPMTKEGQRPSLKNVFLADFSQEQQAEIREILEQGRYIPQEILNIGDF